MGEVGEEPPVDPSLEQLRRGVGTVEISAMILGSEEKLGINLVNGEVMEVSG